MSSGWGRCGCLCGLLAAGAVSGAELAFIESFDADHSGWAMLEIVEGEHFLYDALWDPAGRMIWDSMGAVAADVYLFADEQSSAGRLTGDYTAAGVERIVFDLAFTNVAAVDALRTYLVTRAGLQFEYAWTTPADDSWRTYSAPLDGARWSAWDPASGDWVNRPPSAAELSEVVEVGVVVRTVESPAAWDLFLDDFQLMGEGPVPLAAARFVEEFGRGNASWLLYTLAPEGGLAEDAPWDEERRVLAYYPTTDIEEVWLMADVVASRGRLSGDYAAAGVAAIEFELRLGAPQNVAGFSTYLRTGTGRHFEFEWNPPRDDDWWRYTAPLDGAGWARWDGAAQEWIAGAPSAADLADVIETGVLLWAVARPGAWSVHLDDFGLVAAEIAITAIEWLGGDQIRLEWESPGPVLIELSRTLAPADFAALAGPVSGGSWTGLLPPGLRQGYLRLRQP